MEKDLQARIDALTQSAIHIKQELEHSKQMVASLRASEERYRALCNATSFGLAQLTSSGCFLEVNRAFCDILGYSREELLAHNELDVTHPADRKMEEHHHHQLLLGNRHKANWEKRYIRKDGATIWVNMTLSVSPKNTTKASYLWATVENISEQKRLQESLHRVAANLADTEGISLAGTWKWNVATGDTMASEAVFHLFSLPPSSTPVPLETFLSRIHREDRPAVEQALRKAIAEHTPYQTQYRLSLPNGTERMILARGEMYTNSEDDAPCIMIGMVKDITQRKQTQEALQESEQRFRQLFDNAVDGIFIADHDGKYIDVNRSACNMLGYRRDELLGKRITDLIRESDHQRLAMDKEYFLQDVSHVQVAEWQLRHKNGTYIPVEISARILPDGLWMAIARDIRERKQTQLALERYAAEVQDLYDNAPCGYHSLDRDGIFVQINQTELSWLGYTREEVVGKKKITELLSSDSQNKFYEYFPKLLETGRTRDLEVDMVRKDGTVLPVLLNASALFDDQGKFIATRTTLYDMTELAEAQKKLQQAAAVFEHTNDAIIIANADRIISAVNKAFSNITGYQPDEVIGKTTRLLVSEPQDNEFYRTLWSALEQNGQWQGEIWGRRKSGEIFPAWESITAVKDKNGKVTDYIAIFSDITAIKETEKKLRKLAYHDPLTGLPNRLLFNDRMSQALAYAKRHQTRVALLLLDLDRFKLINDTLGHTAGDQLLQAIGARLHDAIREEDTVARLGGDEFAIILTQLTDTRDAALLAQKAVQLVSQPIHIAGQGLTISTSIGIGVYPDDANDAESLSKAADSAMYSAKDKGRNAYEFYTQDMTKTATELLTIDRELRNAVRRDEFVLFYQPKIDLATGSIVGLEALIRWENPADGLRLPNSFIYVAEETDLIESIGDWVFEAACKQIRQWRQANLPPVRVAINLSARQIKRPRFLEEMRRKLLAYQCTPDGFGLDIEVTETALQTDANIAGALKELKALGLKIAIDDFGTGYSSLNSLKHLPVDILKIDRSFIHGLPADSGNKAITSAIIAMGHSLGMHVIAEGIETQEQLHFVMGQHCDEAQGFLFFPPLPASECEGFLRSGSAAAHFEY